MTLYLRGGKRLRREGTTPARSKHLSSRLVVVVARSLAFRCVSLSSLSTRPAAVCATRRSRRNRVYPLDRTRCARRPRTLSSAASTPFFLSVRAKHFAAVAASLFISPPLHSPVISSVTVSSSDQASVSRSQNFVGARQPLRRPLPSSPNSGPLEPKGHRHKSSLRLCLRAK